MEHDYIKDKILLNYGIEVKEVINGDKRQSEVF